MSRSVCGPGFASSLLNLALQVSPANFAGQWLIDHSLTSDPSRWHEGLPVRLGDVSEPLPRCLVENERVSLIQFNAALFPARRLDRQTHLVYPWLLHQKTSFARTGERKRYDFYLNDSGIVLSETETGFNGKRAITPGMRGMIEAELLLETEMILHQVEGRRRVFHPPSLMNYRSDFRSRVDELLRGIAFWFNTTHAGKWSISNTHLLSFGYSQKTGKPRISIGTSMPVPLDPNEPIQPHEMREALESHLTQRVLAEIRTDPDLLPVIPSRKGSPRVSSGLNSYFAKSDSTPPSGHARMRFSEVFGTDPVRIS